MFEKVYASTWHHPVLFWAIGAPWLVYLMRRYFAGASTHDARLLRLALVVFQLEILVDAWLTSPWSVMPEGSAVAITFVILGDLRYFFLLERFSFPDRIERWAGGALALSLLVPLVTLPAKWLWPGRPHFLTYELTFLVLALVIRFWVLPRRRLDAPLRRWLERLTLFEIVQYLLWATADIVILLGNDAGFLVRLIPNTMYYAAFVPFVWLTAHEEIRT